jgi:phage-related protein
MSHTPSQPDRGFTTGYYKGKRDAEERFMNLLEGNAKGRNEMTREEYLTLYVGAATIALSLESKNDKYADIWRDVRRVIVRSSASFLVNGEHDENVLALCQSLMDHGRLA